MNKTIKLLISIFAISITMLACGMELESQLMALPEYVLIGLPAADDGVKNKLSKVNRNMNQKVSITGSCVDELIIHPWFYTNKKNRTFLAFNAAWNGDIDRLTILQKNMTQRDYRYQYKVVNGFSSSLDLVRIVKTKLSKQYSEIEKNAATHGCDLDFFMTCGPCNELVMACYNNDPQAVTKALRNNDDGWENALYIVIDRDSVPCINALHPGIKKSCESSKEPMRINSYENALEVAMSSGKKEVFKALVTNDSFGCFNACYSIGDNYKTSVFDWISVTDPSPTKENATFYRTNGGKTYKELNKPCLIQ